MTDDTNGLQKNAPTAVDFIRAHVVAIVYGITAATVLIALFVWAESNHWRFAGLSTYRLFPLFGLIAFSIFWSQYIAMALAKLVKLKPGTLRRYFTVTSYTGLGAILLHPSLLIYQLWMDGFGLPPGSIINHYAPPGLGWVVLLGVTSWLIFITYYFYRFFEKYKWWRWFKYIAEVAILAVFYHGFRLGGELQDGWFRVVWLGYGVVLVIALLYLHWQPKGSKTKKNA